MKKPTIVDVIWVCDNCMFVHASGVDLRFESEGGNPLDPDPWNLWALARRAGLLAMGGEHDNGCPAAVGSGAVVCGCETREQSILVCQGCGNRTDGRRHAFTLFEQE